MARTIQVTPEQLETAATKISGLATDYKTQYDTLYKETDSMASTWQGKDNVAYIAQINGFKDDLLKMKQLMDDYSAFLNKSAKAYRDIQDSITTQAKQLIN